MWLPRIYFARWVGGIYLDTVCYESILPNNNNYFGSGLIKELLGETNAALADVSIFAHCVAQTPESRRVGLLYNESQLIL